MSADIEVMVDAAERLKNGHTVNGVVQPLLTDLYQITMAYAYWKAGKSNESAVFDVFFRKNPFNGEFTIFAGLEECLKYLRHFKFSQSDLDYLKTVLPSTIEDQFFDYLANVSGDQIILSAVPEGYAVFPREPLMRLEGPLPVVQLMETTLLNLVNYASLVTTNAVRFRLAAGHSIQLMEFGLRRAQGPDGGLSASKYAYMGGFDGTSNLLAGKLYGIPVKGTHAHAFIMSFSSCDQLTQTHLADRKTGKLTNFVDLVQKRQGQVANTLNLIQGEASDGELAAFISYAIAFPHGFLALVDTYDVIRSGFLNFCSVALALNDLGYRALGVRIDSGDLAYLSIMGHNLLSKIAKEFQLPWMNDLLIIASNDINEDTIISLNEQRHKINSFGIGTHLVTCQRQPALGCVYKLVEINSKPCIKLSLDIEKVTIPCKKQVYRLYGKEGFAMLDLMCRDDEPGPQMSQRVLCRHPFVEAKRCFATASRVEPLLKCWWSDGQVTQPLPTLHEIRNRVKHSVNMLRPDIRRHLNPTPYKVSVSEQLYSYMHQLWLERAPIGELS